MQSVFSDCNCIRKVHALLPMRIIMKFSPSVHPEAENDTEEYANRTLSVDPSVFYRFIWFHYNFSVFMVLIFFSRCHVFYPLFHLSGLPFSFFVNNLTFSLLSTFFIPSLRFLSLIAISHHFLAFHCFSLPFLFFSPMSILHFPLFSRFLPFLNSFLSFLLFPPLPSFYTLFLPFF